MGILDMLNLIVYCMCDGILTMLGAVYCSAPDFIYIKGAMNISEFFKVFILWAYCQGRAGGGVVIGAAATPLPEILKKIHTPPKNKIDNVNVYKL